TLHVFTPWFAEHPPTTRRRAELGRLYRRLPDGEKDRLASLLAFGNGDTDPFLLSLVLAGDDPRGRTARLAGRPEALAQAFRAAGSAERRRALLLRLLAGTGKDTVPLVLPLLRDAREGEAAVLLFWLRGRFQLGDAVPPALAAWVADARSAPEAERVLWAGAAATSGNRDFLLPSARQLAARLPLAVAGGTPAVALLGRAALSCPDEYGRSTLWSALVEAAGEADRPLLLDFLRQATGDEGESLAGWFAQHPDPAAIPALKALLDRPGATSLMPGHDGSAVATALAAAGDPEIVARVSALFERRPVYTAYGLTQVLLRSPLPEAAEAARRLLPQAAPGPG
ncbi:MAG TPA: hypothetical protein VOA87_04390, partial [Thermoanaerobaculia bacterium]|nr:hypothetical protein [Thermoanaerobaculia bacterium]